jgi:Hemolysins and related proteins containing CBS domains
LGELVPKRIGMSSPSTVARLVAKPMYFLSKIAAPFVWILAKSTTSVVKILNLKSDSNKVTEQEIKSMIEEGSLEGEVQEVEHDIVERVFLLGDLKVNSLMTYRKEIVTLDINMNMNQIREIIAKNLHESYPVVDGNIDNLKGIVSLKDIVISIGKEDFKISDIITKATYFHEGMSVYNALEQMKINQIKVALIYDEFGSCQGIISLKDILEGLVGNCCNDSTEYPQIIEREDKKSWLIDAKYPLHNFLSYFDKEDLYPNDADFSTVGGLILDLLEYIPQCGEKIEWNEFTFEIVDLDGARIDKIIVYINPSI